MFKQRDEMEWEKQFHAEELEDEDVCVSSEGDIIADTEDDGYLHVTCRTGMFLGRHGSLAASKRAPEHYLPMIGDVILYNENTNQIEAGFGCFGKTPRGIGRVIGYGGPNNCQMFMMVYRRPGCNHRESFLTQDFRTGIFLYRRLTDYVYTVGRYEYEDLSLDHPHKDIAELFADDGNYLVPEKDQIYNKAVRGCYRQQHA